MSESLYTIGHSTRTIPMFVALLQAAAVRMVVDIRSVPRSRTNPQYNLDSLPEALAPWQIGHLRIEELGGLRSKSKTVAPEVNGYWTNQSFHNYADHALGPEFDAGLERLLDLAGDHKVAIMCAEAVWWRCHRRIVADYLIARGRDVFHLMGDSRIDPARINPAAQRIGTVLHYPAPPR